METNNNTNKGASHELVDTIYSVIIPSQSSEIDYDAYAGLVTKQSSVASITMTYEILVAREINGQKETVRPNRRK